MTVNAFNLIVKDWNQILVLHFWHISGPDPQQLRLLVVLW